jgi:hypothetical protein
MICMQKRAGAAEIDDFDVITTFGTSRPQSLRRNDDVEAALQYLTWAFEHMEKASCQTAARHTRAAMAALRTSVRK